VSSLACCFKPIAGRGFCLGKKNLALLKCLDNAHKTRLSRKNASSFEWRQIQSNADAKLRYLSSWSCTSLKNIAFMMSVKLNQRSNFAILADLCGRFQPGQAVNQHF
jgi:hypothetical protein